METEERRDEPCGLLVVEDDGIIRRGIVSNIPWAEHGIKIVGTARNGREGLELARAFSPRVVLSDIRMPFLDGIDFAAELRKLDPCIKVVFLTAYGEFDYAREALALHASDYLLKCASNEELLAAILRARDEWLADEELRARAAQGLAASEERTLAELLSLGVRAAAARPSIPGPWRVVVLREERGQGAINLGLSLEEALRSRGWPLMRTELSGDAIFVVGRPESSWQPEERVESCIAACMDSLEGKGAGRGALVGVSDERSEASELSDAWDEALAAISTIVATGDRAVACYGYADKSSNERRLREASDYMAKNYQRPGLGLVETAAAVGVSPAYLSTIFKKCGNLNFRDHLASLRVGKAKELLSSSRIPVHSIAQIVGCPNAQHFSVLFKRVSGQSPNEFRQGSASS
jgi:two-component system response regulator YesN